MGAAASVGRPNTQPRTPPFPEKKFSPPPPHICGLTATHSTVIKLLSHTHSHILLLEIEADDDDDGDVLFPVINIDTRQHTICHTLLFLLIAAATAVQ